MKEENELRKKYGAPNPFSVPEGYFENLAGKVMEQLPEKESQPQPEVTMWERVRPWVYMAAMFWLDVRRTRHGESIQASGLQPERTYRDFLRNSGRIY